MDENNELLNDYKECCDRIIHFNNYDYTKIFDWALLKYSNWILKDERYVLGVTGGCYKPIDEKEKAWNAVNNLKTTLKKIAIIKGIQM